MKPPTEPHSVRGFTLIELLIALVVAAVLALVALPSYSQYLQRAHRAHARAALLQLAQWMERSATANGRYPLAADVTDAQRAVEGGRYAIEVEAGAGVSYRLIARPLGAQAADPCGSFQLDHTGRRSQGATDRVAQPLDARRCWER